MRILIITFGPGQNAPFTDYFQIQMKFWINNLNFQPNFSDWWWRHLLWNCPRMHVTEDKSTSVKVNQWLDTTKQQAISWANTDKDLWHHMASLANNELIVTKIIAPICQL